MKKKFRFYYNRDARDNTCVAGYFTHRNSKYKKDVK